MKSKEIPKPKISDIINYITNKKMNEIPENFIHHQNELKRVIFYTFEYFWRFPKIIEYLNKYNFMFNDEGLRKIEDDPIEFIKLLKLICDENQIFKYQLKNSFFNIVQAMNTVKELEEIALKNNEQLIDVICDIKVKEKLDIKNQIKKSKSIKKKDDDYSKIKNVVKDAVEKNREKQQEKIKERLSSNNTILTELNDEIIEMHQLTLIDTYVNKNKNEIIYIFIDKDYQKKYYIEQFWCEFFINAEQGIINNDYLFELNDENKKHVYRYISHNFWDINRLKNSVKKNYENFMKIYEI